MPERKVLPTVFLGSSTEGLPIAKEVHRRLSKVAHVDLWNSAFDAGSWTLQVILDHAQKADFGLFVISADDNLEARGRKYSTVRDNVLFEAGVFMGALGPERTFLLWPSGGRKEQRLPSDLLGLTLVTYEAPKRARKVRLARSLSKLKRQITAAGLALRSGYNEIAGLKAELKKREQLFTDDSTESFLSIVRRAAKQRREPWSRETHVEVLISSVRKHCDDNTIADNTFWWLIVYGVITFDNIDIWNDGVRWHWKSSVDYTVFTDRGVVLLNELRSGRAS